MMTYQLPCTDCGAPTPTKRPKPRRCDPCAKAEALDYSRWHYRTFRDEMLEYHRNASVSSQSAWRDAPRRCSPPSTTATARRRCAPCSSSSKRRRVARHCALPHRMGMAAVYLRDYPEGQAISFV
jgi:hypothetical protein